MNRREFLKAGLQTGVCLSVLGSCGKIAERDWRTEEGRPADRGSVTLYDTNAMALYMDGGLGPKTGIIRVQYILDNQPLTFQFWHGHGGKNHMFSLSPEHYVAFKQLKKVTIQTTEVEGHTHKLFVDFSDPRWRVSGAQPIEVPILI